MTISDQINEAFTSTLRPENARKEGYLGMSMVGGCPAAAYDSYYGEREEDVRLLWYGFSGGAYESKIYDLLSISQEAIVVPKSHYLYHIEANFDSRYRGHADIILSRPIAGYAVVDVKSLDWRKFSKLKLRGQLPYSHDKNICQVQAYMDHGGFDHGAIVYTPRDIPHNEWPDDFLEMDSSDLLPFDVVDVERDLAVQISLNKKATWLLEMIDAEERPECTCGWCERTDPHEAEVSF